MIELLVDEGALQRIDDEAIVALTEAATESSFYVDGMNRAQISANRRVVAISAETCRAAATNDNQHFAAAFAGGAFAGFAIATIHAADDRELDWMMVHPNFHGTGVAAALMADGIAWLGENRRLWLNVIRHNARAIRFYRRFEFEVDPHAVTSHAVPHWIMRREIKEGA